MIYLQSLTKVDLAQMIATADLEGRIDPEVLRRIEIGRESEASIRKRAVIRSKQIFQWVYHRYVLDWDGMTDLSKALRVWLKSEISILRLQETHGQQSMDGTRKFLWQLGDGKTVESVVIPFALKEKSSVDSPLPFSGREKRAQLDSTEWQRLTVCISSQVGCAMACKFCLTGVQGFDRHLKTEEIVTQVLELRTLAPITNIVFMGMGEPLHNLEAVAKACEILLDEDGLNFSKRKITVSTSGLVPAIRELGKRVDVSLAISLNATTDEQRDWIMPVNKKWNIQELLSACRQYPLGPHRRITFEYVLLKDFNDSIEDAQRLERLLRGIPSKINLIPFNEHSGSDFKRPPDDRVRVFQKYLLDHQLTATVRISRGRDILAACGQLRSLFGTARGSERHKDLEHVLLVGDIAKNRNAQHGSDHHRAPVADVGQGYADNR